MSTQTRKRIAENLVTLRKVHIVTPTDREESNELETDLRRMGYLGLWEKSWRVRSEDMVRELVTGEVDHIYTSTIRDRPDRWNAELWSRVYGFKQGGEGMTTKRENCTRNKFSQRLDPKYGYFVKDCKDERKKSMLVFLKCLSSVCKSLITSLLPLPPPCFLPTPKRRWWIREASSESWCTSWHPTPNAVNPLLLGLSSSTCTHTETYSLIKRDPMNIASIHARASDYQLGAGDGPRGFERGRHGGV